MASLNLLTRTTSRSRPRVGRGGKRGKTAGRGTKGQNARAGRKKRPEWRDIIKKLPKRRGFGKNRGRTVNPLRVKPTAISLATLETLFKDGGEVSPQTLAERGVIIARGSKFPPVKIVASDVVSKKFSIKGCVTTEKAKAMIEKAGGAVAV